MNGDSRYYRVGLFVFSGLAAITATIVILGGSGLFDDTVVFETYFAESVEGLEVGSPVKVRGVKVGSVSHIGFVRDDYEFDFASDRLKYGQRVLVRMDMTGRGGGLIADEGDMRGELKRLIDQGLRLRLSQAGLTGLQYVEADFVDPQKNEPMKITWTPLYTYVPSTPSTLKSLSSAAERIFARLEDVKVEQMVVHLDELIVAVADAVNELEVGDVQTSVGGFLGELRATNARLQRILDGGRYDLEVALENLRVASENLRDLSDTARQYPSLMILGNPPEPSRP